MIKISVDITSENSVKSALVEYKKLINTRKAISSKNYGGKLNVLFCSEDGLELEIEDFKNREVLASFEEYWEYSYGGRSNEDTFFAYALTYKTLNNIVLEILLEIINYSREKNSTEYLWADDDSNLIGLGTIYAFAKLYPEYTYLLGLYLIPYWDDEHAFYALQCAITLANKMGICRDTLKLFCYSDNSFLRDSIFDNMTAWFRANKSEYDWFKTTLKERFINYPFIQYSERYAIKHPIDEFYFSLISGRPDYNSCEEPETADFSDFFVYDNTDLEASNLEMEIIEFINKPLIQEKKAKKKRKSLNPLLTWQNFIEAEFKYGREIWAYIYSGGDRTVLYYLNGLYEDIGFVVAESNYQVKKYIPDWISDTETFFEELSRISEELFDYFKNNFAMVYRDMIIRFTDFLYELSGRKPFDEDYINMLVDDYGISESVIHERYPLGIELRFEREFEDFVKRGRGKYKSKLDKIGKTLLELKEKDSKIILDCFSNLLTEDDFYKKSQMFLISAWILKDDKADSFFASLKAMLNENMFEVFSAFMEDNMDYRADKNEFKKFRQDIFDGRQISLEELKKYFDYDEDNDFNSYDFDFLRSSKVLGKIFQSIFLLLKKDFSVKNEFRNIYNFVVSINPVKAINILSNLYREEYRDLISLVEVQSDLKKTGIKDEYINVWKLFYYYDNNLKEELEIYLDELINNYGDSIDEILAYLFMEERSYFYRLIKERYPHLNYLDKLIYSKLREFNLYNFDSLPTIAYKNINDLNTLYNGYLKSYTGNSLESEKLRNFDYWNQKNFAPRLETTDKVLMIYEGDDFGIYGDYYLVDTYNKERDELEGNEKLIIVRDFEGILTPLKICDDIELYLKGEKTFDQVSSYLKYMDSKYIYEGRGAYNITDAFFDMSIEEQKRFLNFYLRISYEMYEIIFKKMFDNKNLRKIIDMLLELEFSLDNVLRVFVEEHYYEEIRILSEKMDVVEAVKSYSEKDRIKALTVFSKDRYLTKFLRYFKDDKSRLVRELAVK
jgi:hypothetical protein